MDFDFVLVYRISIIAGALWLSGCGGGQSTPPKTDLSEQEKQQIKELNEQRASEWGPKKKK